MNSIAPRAPRLMLLAAPLCLAPLASAQLAGTIREGVDDGGHFGSPLANLGDLTGDGIDDFIVGEPNYGALGDGRIAVYDGATATLLFAAVGGTGEELGSSVAGVGDWNGDGTHDFAYAAPSWNGASNDRGAIYVASGVDGTVFRTFLRATNQRLGDHLAAAGDLDGDKIQELLVGDPAADELLIYKSSGALLVKINASGGDRFGYSPARLGDLDGDGVDEIAASARFYDDARSGLTDCGRVLIFSGKTRAQLFSIRGLANDDYFATRIARLDDLDGDGTADWAAGTYYADPNGHSSGQVRVFSGKRGSTLWTLNGLVASELYGIALDGLPDLNDDGVGDFAIGGPYGGTNGLGHFEVRNGQDGTLLWSRDGTTASLSANEALGLGVLGGNFDGDGVGDLLVADPYCDRRASLFLPWKELGTVQWWYGAPAYTSHYGSGLAGTFGTPQLSALDKPILGATFDVALTNSRLATTTALLLLGTSAINVPYKGGSLLVQADLASIYFTLPSLGTVLTEDLPNDPTLNGLELFVQVLEADPGAVKKISMTDGLKLHLGWG
ncbi:MAG: VCBS repeat-containing protein [Planctomycetes bacterium]|nr:VCBS repeat-containing protein [Planctomycetota bacterium]